MLAFRLARRGPGHHSEAKRIMQRVSACTAHSRRAGAGTSANVRRDRRKSGTCCFLVAILQIWSGRSSFLQRMSIRARFFCGIVCFAQRSCSPESLHRTRDSWKVTRGRNSFGYALTAVHVARSLDRHGYCSGRLRRLTRRCS